MIRRMLLCLCCVLLTESASAVTHVQEVSPGVWLIEDHTLPIVTVKVTFENSGAAYDPEGKKGLASFVSDMLDEGAGDMDSLAFHSALESSAIRFGADAQEDIFTVSVQTLSEYKDRAWGLLNLALSKPRFDADAVERIRSGIESELRQVEEDPGYLASLNWKRLAFPGHPYASPRRGTLASIAAMKAEDLREYVKTHFSCSTKIVAVVGDVTAQEVKQWLSASPANVSAACNQITPAVADIAVADGGAVPVFVGVNVPQTVVAASLPGVMRNDPRYYAVVVLNHILGGGSLTARLGKEIRDKRGLAYYAESELTALDHTGYISVQFATRAAQAHEAVTVFKAELGKISTDGVTKEELMDAKSYLTGSFPLQIDTQGALADYLLSMQHYHLGPDYLEKRNSLIEAVTLEQVNDMAKTLLSHPPLIVMAGQSEEIKK